MPGSTTNFGFEYPLSTDPISDGAQEIQNFAETADATFVDLKGGTTDQVLAKNSNTDMDFKWIASPATPTLGAFESGQIYVPDHSTTSASTIVDNQTNYMPIWIPEACTVDRIGIRSGGTHSGTSSVRIGIFLPHATLFRPGDLLLDAGTVSVTATNTNYEITISQALDKGWYWLAMNVYDDTGTKNFHSINLNLQPMPVTNNFGKMAGRRENVDVTLGFANSGTLLTNTSQLPVTVYLRGA